MRVFSIMLAAAMVVVMAVAGGPAHACQGLEGLWTFKVVAGESEGDFGQIEISRGEDGLVGAMEFTDSRFMEMAEQACAVVEAEDAIAITCTVDAPFWAPDDFRLVRDGVDTMSGDHISIMSGRAQFRREGSCGFTS